MVPILVRILLFLGGLWLLRRLLAYLVAGVRRQMGPSSSRPTEKAQRNTVKDPVCGMYMDPRLAVRLDFKTGSFYFCSEECRRKFLARPG
jgi:uncharacterized protein